MSDNIQKSIKCKNKFQEKHNMTEAELNSQQWKLVILGDKDFNLAFCKFRKKFVDNLLKYCIDVIDTNNSIISVAAGSSSPNSDYDITLYDINHKNEWKVVKLFNELFGDIWGNSSSIVFDTNIYGVGFLRLRNNEPDTRSIKDTKGNTFYYNKQFNANKQYDWAMLHLIKSISKLSSSEQQQFNNKFIVKDVNRLTKKYTKLMESFKTNEHFSPDKLTTKYISQMKNISRSGDTTDNKISSVLFYGVETYFSRGAFMHVVVEMQMKLDMKLSVSEYIQSIIENFAFIVYELHISTDSTNFITLFSKYIDRIIDAFKRLGRSNSECLDNQMYKNFNSKEIISKLKDARTSIFDVFTRTGLDNLVSPRQSTTTNRRQSVLVVQIGINSTSPINNKMNILKQIVELLENCLMNFITTKDKPTSSSKGHVRALTSFKSSRKL